MASLRIHIKGWDDGQQVERSLDTFDRWAIHAADQVTVELGDTSVMVNQKPHAITAKRMGVGACLWEGELLLAAYIAFQLPRHRLVGARCVELGAGPGLAGLLAAKLGAAVVISDKEVVLPLIRENLGLNGLRQQPPAGGGGSVQVEELEWGKEGYMRQVGRLAALPIDLVLAADVTYIDQDGESPSTPHFVAAARGLCTGPATRVLVSCELRSEAVRSGFLEEAAKVFSQIRRVPRTGLPGQCLADHVELYELRA